MAVTSAASAAAPQNQGLQTIKTASRTSTLNSTVTVPNIAWSSSNDGVTVSAKASGPAATPAAQRTDAETADDADAAEQGDGTQAATAARATAAVSRSETRTAVPAASSSASAAVSIAKQYLGVPYVSGGESPAGFDCSGLVQYVYRQLGIDLPRTANEQGQSGTVIPASEARPGDLVWHTYGHIGIYAGDGLVIEATKPGDVVKIQPLWGSYLFVRV